MTYQLRRLRLHGRIQRLLNTLCYHVTETGFRAALFFTRAYNRLLRPGLAAAVPGHRATPTGLKLFTLRSPGAQTSLRQNRCPPHCNDQRTCIGRMKLGRFTVYVSTQAQLDSP